MMAKIAFYILVMGMLLSPTYALALDLALVVGDDAALDANKDTPLKNHCELTLGHTITVKDDQDSGYDPTTFDCVIISESANSGNTGWLKDEVVPILTVEGANYDEFELGSGGSSNITDGTDMDILEPTHHIAAGLSGTVTVLHNASNAGNMSGWANDVTAVAVYDADNNEAWCLYVDQGGTLQGGVNTAADRRAFVAAQYFNRLNADGLSVFNAALEWVTRTIPVSQQAVIGTNGGVVIMPSGKTQIESRSI